ncbi:MAG TPA: hypothetical protein VGR41_04430 [Actinomycetota bacterium]|nr:hypothetical protein [Actinomycetota bacterium]
MTNPSKTFFHDPGLTKLDLVRYWIEVARAALAGCRDRPPSCTGSPTGP